MATLIVHIYGPQQVPIFGMELAVEEKQFKHQPGFKLVQILQCLIVGVDGLQQQAFRDI